MAGNLSKRIVLYIQLQLKSPLNVSSGMDDITDSDVIRDAEGRPFVAGSSLAGAARAYLGKSKHEDCLMGYSGKIDNKNQSQDIGRMSSLFISDFVFDFDIAQPKTNVRDGVALEEDQKVAKAGSKYDMEIIEAGARGHFYMELSVRKGDDESQMRREVSYVIKGMDDGEVRLGSKKTRGFGEVTVSRVSSRTYDAGNWLEYKDAFTDVEWGNAADEKSSWLAAAPNESQTVHIRVPLRMPGGISIRQYAARKGEPDFVHLSDHGFPVIPGSSMAGSLRSRILQIIAELQNNGQQLPMKATEIINTAFGFVNGKDGHASRIIVGETVIKDAADADKPARSLIMVRNGISRFESAAKSGALYKEKTYVNGTMTLEILVRKNTRHEEDSETRWIIGLLMLAIKDLQQGLLAVGGQTAIGRGILLENGPIEIDGRIGKENRYISELVASMLSAGEREHSDMQKAWEGGSAS